MEPEYSINVGERIKALREEKRISLRVLSKQSGISANALSLIERGRTSPTVTTLVAIARAFNLSVNALFSAADQGKDEFVVYKRGKFARDHAIEAMVTNLKDQNLSPLLLHLAPDEKFRKDLCFHPGDEFVYCLSGGIECELETTKISLKAGDAITYKAEIPHRLQGISPSGSDVLVVFEAGRL
jgi:transcriptional regulator with XRE-family HTH domain